MAVNKANIKSSLLSLYNSGRLGDGITDDDFADAMADIIRNAILSADVNTGITSQVASGITVQVDPNSGIGATNGIGVGTTDSLGSLS